MTYETEIQKWIDEGYSINEEYTSPISGRIHTLLLNENLDKVRVYEAGYVWKSNLITGEYELLYTFQE